MKYRAAFATITVKVFVPEYEIADALGLKGDEDLTATDKLVSAPLIKVQTAFEDLANDKVHAAFPTDDPMKLQEVDIHMDTFQ